MARSGLSVPTITAIDDAGELDEADQRRVIRYVVQNGEGAASIFISGTTGEFNRISNRQRQRLIEIGCQEVRAINRDLPAKAAPVEVWASVTAPARHETLENIALALALEAEMVVIAPLAITDLPPREIVSFIEKDVGALIGPHTASVVGIYDNPDISVHVGVPGNLALADVRSLSQLSFVAGIKASTTRHVLVQYLDAFARNGARRPFDVYVGNAPLLFELEDMQRQAQIRDDRISVGGVVAGPANLLPREWANAWRAVLARDDATKNKYQTAFAQFEQECICRTGQSGGGEKYLASLKRCMVDAGIISSPFVAPGTPSLTEDESHRVSEAFAAYRVDLDYALRGEERSSIPPQDASRG